MASQVHDFDRRRRGAYRLRGYALSSAEYYDVCSEYHRRRDLLLSVLQKAGSDFSPTALTTSY